jgi:hypothetical protein
MGREKERQIQEDEQAEKRRRRKEAEDGYIPPIRPFEEDDD